MSPIPDTEFDRRIGAVRSFSRFYTRRIGLLQHRFLQSSFSLTQGRVLYEIAHGTRRTASDIVTSLGIDAGYLSRILRGFEERELITRKRASDDGRQAMLSLTAKGRLAYAALDKRSQDEVGGMLSELSDADQRRVVGAMNTIEGVMSHQQGHMPAVSLRPHRAGDMGWVVARHGTLYAQEYGWDSTIEAITAEIVAAFLKKHDPACERCWIAELDGEAVGSIFLMRERADVARIRLLIVDPKARGLGIGNRLVDECISFAKIAGYRRITLWTHAVLTAARAIYKQRGFQLVRQWVHEDFGKPLESETWELVL